MSEKPLAPRRKHTRIQSVDTIGLLLEMGFSTRPGIPGYRLWADSEGRTIEDTREGEYPYKLTIDGTTTEYAGLNDVLAELRRRLAAKGGAS